LDGQRWDAMLMASVCFARHLLGGLGVLRALVCFEHHHPGSLDVLDLGIYRLVFYPMVLARNGQRQDVLLKDWCVARNGRRQGASSQDS
jgi:hypothetical protein